MYQNHGVAQANPDGTGLISTQVPPNFFQADNIRWDENGQGFTLAYSSGTGIFHFDSLGQQTSAITSFDAQDFDYLLEGRIGYLGSGHIGIFDPITGISEMLYDILHPSNKYDIAYSSKHNGLIWSTDTVVGLTNIETGQTTILKVGAYGIAHYSSVTASTNGYLAFRANVVSPTLSTSNSRLERDELRFINADGTEERRLVLDFQ